MKLTKSFFWTLIIAIVSALNGAGWIPKESNEYTGIASQIAGLVVAVVAGIWQLILVYRQAHSNPDGTSAKLPYIEPKL